MIVNFVVGLRLTEGEDLVRKMISHADPRV